VELYPLVFVGRLALNLEGRYMDFSMASLIDSTRIEKILLAKKVGQFLSTDQAEVERRTVENVARVLAQDISCQVRGVLAYELRQCSKLSKDLAKKIATDIEQVSGPFLQATRAFSDDALEQLVPELEDSVRAWIARRSDLPENVIHKLVSVGLENSVAALLRNDCLELPEQACCTVIERFSENRRLMDHMGARKDLPLSIAERIIEKVSDHFKHVLVEHYYLDDDVAEDLSSSSGYEVMWQQIRVATTAQIHAFVTDLKINHRLTHQTVVEMANRGSMTFLESALALQTGQTVDKIKEIMTLKDASEFVKLMKKASVPDAMAPKYLGLIKANNKLNM